MVETGGARSRACSMAGRLRRAAAEHAAAGRHDSASSEHTSREDAPGRQAVLSRQGPGLAVLLSLVAAGIALLLATATTLFSVLTSARRRGWELAALAALGVPEKDLRRASRRESLLLLAVGLGLGAVGGVIACVATLRSIPYFADTTSVRLSLRPAPEPLAVLGEVQGSARAGRP